MTEALFPLMASLSYHEEATALQRQLNVGAGLRPQSIEEEHACRTTSWYSDSNGS